MSIEKTYGEEFRVDFDWSDRLAVGDSVGSAVWSVDKAGLTLNTTGTTATKSYAFLRAGGVIGQTYFVKCTMTTSNPPTKKEVAHALVEIVRRKMANT